MLYKIEYLLFENIVTFERRLYRIDFEDDGEEESDGGWQLELQRRYAQEANFMAELRARQSVGSPPENQQQAYAQANFQMGYYQHQHQQQQQQNYMTSPQNQGPFGGPHQVRPLY